MDSNVIIAILCTVAVFGIIYFGYCHVYGSDYRSRNGQSEEDCTAAPI